MSLSLESSAFSENTTIPIQFTCKGHDVSPPLTWKDDASTTRSYVLIMDDPDAPHGTWDHWVLFNIPANIKHLEEGAQTPTGATSGRNTYGTTGYRGPCPPTGTHRYFFKLYALDSKLSLDDSATKQDVMKAMQGHIITQAQLLGLYTLPK